MSAKMSELGLVIALEQRTATVSCASCAYTETFTGFTAETLACDAGKQHTARSGHRVKNSYVRDVEYDTVANASDRRLQRRRTA